MKAKELSLSDEVYFINHKSNIFSSTTISKISSEGLLHQILIRVEPGTDLIVSDTATTFEIADVEYFFDKLEWYEKILPLQEKRVDNLEFELSGAKDFLNEIKQNLNQ